MITHASRLALGVLLLVSIASQAPAAEAGCRRHERHIKPHGVRAKVEFIGMMGNGRERQGRQFPGGRLRDLKVFVQWRNLSGNHQQRLDIIAPDGSLYQSLPRPLTAAHSDDVVVETLLPVKGTWITRYGLYGAWCVKVFLDQDEAPITSRRLVIAPPR